MVFFLTLFLNVLVAQDLKLPELTGSVIDEVGLLSNTDKLEITQSLSKMLNNNGPQMVVYLTHNLQGYDIADFTIRLADKWKLGTAKKDNGLIFIMSIEDRKMRLETGHGLEGDIPDAISRRLLDDGVRSFFKQRRFADGIKFLILQIAQITQSNQDLGIQIKQKSKRSVSWFDLIIFIVVIIISIASRVMHSAQTGFFPTTRRRSNWGYSSGWGGGGSGGFGGGGGFSGGGGSFGGGGSSSSW